MIAELCKSDLPFYESTALKANILWHISVGLVLVSSIATTVIASLINEEQFKSTGRIILIILPAIGTLASGVLNIYRPKEKEVLREDGRIEMVDIIRNGESLLASCKSEDEFKQAYHQIRERARSLEVTQHRSDAALRSDRTESERKRDESSNS